MHISLVPLTFFFSLQCNVVLKVGVFLSHRLHFIFVQYIFDMPSPKDQMHGFEFHMLIGYNAGPGTAASWKRAGGTVTDPLLYIESIPYAETRNYVMQVAAQYWVYQRLMDERPTTLKALANGEWPMVGAGV